MVLLLAEAGASVGIAYRNRAREARETLREAESFGIAGWTRAGDLAEPREAGLLFAHALERWASVDILVANHGVWPPCEAALEEMTDLQWERTIAVNLNSVFRLCREAARRIAEGGRIVLVGSTAGQRGEAFHADYAASKGALASFAKSLCVELAPRGITVNCVAPGWIDTEMAEPAMRGGGREAIEKRIPLGRVARARDVAGPVAFLCSDLARHVTGEVMNFNGGSVLAG